MLKLKVITKERKIIDEEVEEVYLPAETGEIGILLGHRPLIALLGIGILKYIKEGKKYFLGISEGIAEVLNDNVNIFADEIIFKEKIDQEKEKAALFEAEESLKYLSGEELEKAKKRIKRAKTSLDLLK
jgi:F-type H+-transporting ATPase subunit epsilon